MNALQDKIRELDAENKQLKSENQVHRATITVIRAYLKNVEPNAESFEILHDLNTILDKHKSLNS